ncbi:capsular polysaccharide biosynthesis protein CapF [Castellaniella sp. FW104-16D08]|uniref:UDP-2-acetamido-2,6-beta-L-arabino-hexul-4-ose reductase n=1 Tax=unclassified Castellaniella TaxID=2617606 RepID=UPI003315169D
MINVLITGANGFIGQNLQLHLSAREDIHLTKFTRHNAPNELLSLLQNIDFVFHTAGVNRPQDTAEFASGNAGLTQSLCDAVAQVAIRTGRRVPVLFASSIQAERENPYGQSKLAAEEALFALGRQHGVPVHIFRLPNVFGKWARPNYNSAVATFCHNITRDLPIQINDPDAHITLVYIDDVIQHFIAAMDGKLNAGPYVSVHPQYSLSVGELAAQLYMFRESRQTLITEPVGTGLVRALHSTYLSYLPPEQFAYEVPKHSDPRGMFVEMLKTRDSGQFSFFTAHPGITRGGHYHHSKTEKFLVIKGKACFRFRHIVSGEFHQLFTTGDQPEIVETVPGWTHDITNVGQDEMIVMLWANEIFDREHPDTYTRQVGTAD